MKIKPILFIITLAAEFLFLSVAANASEVSWTSETYSAYAYAKAWEDGTIYDEDLQENFSPPLSMPISAGAYAETQEPCFNPGCPSNPVIIYGSASSSASSTSLNVSADAYSW
jgi:hypothetical protein